MRIDDKQVGSPKISYNDTKSNIEALTSIDEGAQAYATDTNEPGWYDGASWVWGASETVITEGPGIDIENGAVGLGGDTILLYDSGGSPIIESPTITGIMVLASSGDIIKIPVGTFSDNITILDGIKVVGTSRYATILTGEITGGDEASIENLSVIRTANDSDDLKGIVVTDAVVFYIHNCDIEVTQAGSGDARALSSEANSAIIEAWNSYLYGSSVAGSGYAGWRDTDLVTSIYIIGGRAVGSSAPFNE
ncbi:hypothetical protein LCGC14_0609670 [marine sediment metagenome]|uniref:Uncharacterized protein n=1 Tax=marine sediment metagenome TaxID=412755 RepID=A0A0F9R864_9ZZZZ